MKTKPIYLDYAAATPVDLEVFKAMQPYFAAQFHNPSALYEASVQVRHNLDAARASVARSLGARPSEVIFTAGATEANNLAISGIMHRYPKASIVTSAVEHDSVLRPAERFIHKCAPVDNHGIVQLHELKKRIDEETVLISVMLANNEVGSIQPLREISQFISEVRSRRQKSGNELPLYLHTDAAQAVNYLDIHVSRLGVDLLSLNGGKMYGPKQSGALYVKAGIQLSPLIEGGGQEWGLRSGTENVPGIIGLATALEQTQLIRKEEAQRLGNLQDLFIKAILDTIADAELHGPKKHRLPNNVHIRFKGIDNERLVMRLDLLGVQAASGSACSASSDEPSHVLMAMGLSVEQAKSSVRFSMGRQTTEADIKKAVQILAAAVKAERK